MAVSLGAGGGPADEGGRALQVRVAADAGADEELADLAAQARGVGAVQAFDEAVGLRPSDLRGAVLDLLELEEQLVGVRSGRPQTSRPLSDSMVAILSLWASKLGSTSLFIRWTAVTGILFRAAACK